MARRIRARGGPEAKVARARGFPILLARMLVPLYVSTFLIE